MHVSARICARLRVSAYLYVRVRLCANVNMLACAFVELVHVCARVCVRVCARKRYCAHVYTRKHACARVHVRVQTCKRVFTYVWTYKRWYTRFWVSLHLCVHMHARKFVCNTFAHVISRPYTLSRACPKSNGLGPMDDTFRKAYHHSHIKEIGTLPNFV